MTKTDPDSRMMRTQGQPTVHGCNAQAAVTRGQIIVAAEIAVERPDFGHLEPNARAAVRELADVTQRPETVLADAGYWHTRQDGEDRQRRNPSPGPAPCGATSGRQAGMGQRSLRTFLRKTRPRGSAFTVTPLPDSVWPQAATSQG